MSYDISKKKGFGENYLTIFVCSNITKSNVNSKGITFQVEHLFLRKKLLILKNTLQWR